MGPVVGHIRVRYGSAGRVYDAVNCVFATADSAVAVEQSVSCTSVAGVGKNLTWEASVQGQRSEAFFVGGGVESASKYVAPAISTVSVSVATLKTQGGEDVTITGTNFGAAQLDGMNGLKVSAVTIHALLSVAMCALFDGVYVWHCR